VELKISDRGGMAREGEAKRYTGRLGAGENYSASISATTSPTARRRNGLSLQHALTIFRTR